MDKVAEPPKSTERRKVEIAELLSRTKSSKKVNKGDFPKGRTRSHLKTFTAYEISSLPEVKALEVQKKAIIDCSVDNPYFRVNEVITGRHTRISGNDLISYSGYNYIGMSGDPFVIERAKQAIDKYGTSPSASRLVTGEKPIHGELERAISKFIGAESALAFPSGHATNVTVIGHFFSSADLIIYDELSHNSIVEGCVLSGARRLSFPHNDYEKCKEIVAENVGFYEKIAVVIEGVYSMDGDIAPLDKFVEIRKEHPVFLYVDEAHSLGTIGETGRGVSELFGVCPGDVDFWMGTLSKSLASNGGYIAGRSELIEYLKYTTPGFVYTAGLSPPNTAAALASLELLELEPKRVERLQKNSDLFRSLALKAGLNIGLSHGTPIIPIIVGSTEAAILMADSMFKRGICVHPIFYPTVPLGEARLRFFVSSLHTEEDITLTVRLIERSLKELKQSD